MKYFCASGICSSHSEESESSESEDEEVQGRDEKLNQSTLDENSGDVKDFATIRTSSPCSDKQKDDNYNMDVDSNEGKCTIVYLSSLKIQNAMRIDNGWSCTKSPHAAIHTTWIYFVHAR